MNDLIPINQNLQQEFQSIFKREDLINFVRHQVFDFNELMAFYRCAMMEIETKFRVLDEEFSCQFERNPIESIKTRLKDVLSINNKLSKKGYDFTTENIEQVLHDVAGVRVICSFIDDVYRLAEALEKQDDITLLERKDYIASPKENGYRSLHLIVAVPIFLSNHKRIMKVEIQLRTIAMDFWASLEHHLRYKKNLNESEKMREELYQCAVVSADLDRRMDALRAYTKENSPTSYR